MAECDTSSRSSNSNGGGRRREACDRCHGQKLRCIFHNQGQGSSGISCVRCEKAGADCVTRVSGRAGRPRMSRLSSLEQHGGNGRGKRRCQRDGATLRHAINADGSRASVDRKTDKWQPSFETNTMDSESSGNAEHLTPVQATSSLPPHDTSGSFRRAHFNFPNTIWPEDSLSTFFNENAGETLNFMAPDLEYSWTSQHQQIQPINTQTLTASRDGDDNHFGDVNVDAQVSGTSGESTNADVPDENNCRAPLHPMKASGPRPPRFPNQNIEAAAAPLSSTVGPLANLPPPINIARDKGRSARSEDLCEIQHQRIQKLSEFAMDLYAQVTSIGIENSQAASTVTSTALRDQLIGGVLKSSIAFLTLLESFSGSATSSEPSSTPSPATITMLVNCNNSNSSPSDSGTSSSSSAFSSERTAVNDITHRLQGNLSANCSDDLEKPPPMDITVILQLVICYIRIVHLHSIMYSRILDYLIAFPLRHAQQHPVPVFPGMQAGGVSLDVFGMFQIKLLIQISVHVLGGIEIALGVPERHRVGKRKPGARRLLDSHLSGKFVECLMKEKAWRKQNVECVRKRLRDLGEVLEGALDA